jgi:hypothetical protein
MSVGQESPPYAGGLLAKMALPFRYSDFRFETNFGSKVLPTPFSAPFLRPHHKSSRTGLEAASPHKPEAPAREGLPSLARQACEVWSASSKHLWHRPATEGSVWGLQSVHPTCNLPDRVGLWQLPYQFLHMSVSSRLPQGNGAPYRIDAALVGAVDRSGVPGYVIAGEKQLRTGVVIGGFQFPERGFMVDANGKGRIAPFDSRIVVP